MENSNREGVVAPDDVAKKDKKEIREDVKDHAKIKEKKDIQEIQWLTETDSISSQLCVQ